MNITLRQFVMEKTEKRLKDGLTSQEVAKNRAKYGVNQLTPVKRASLWQLYFDKFKDPIIQILLIAACFSLLISYIHNDYIETIGIFLAIFLATTIGFYFEYDANKKFDILNAISDEIDVKVIRDGVVQLIERKDIVIGDVVLLEQGEEVPADGFLLEAVSLQINESSLTGEPLIYKFIEESFFDQEATYPSNRVLRGTMVLDGHGAFVVDKIGDDTEIGRVAQLTNVDSEVTTPLKQQLTKLAKFIGKIGFAIAAAVFIIFTARDLYYFLQVESVDSWPQFLKVAEIVLKYFMISVTLLVVAVPEGLPMSVTLSLALNMKRMLRTNNLVRKMHACETMGAITTICTDKTGTLTQNKMTVASIYVQNEDEKIRALLEENMALNSTAYLSEENGKIEGIGNPTEIALLNWLYTQGQDYSTLRDECQILDQLPFSTERKFMATIVQSKVLDKKVIYIKGAPEVILKYCPLNSSEKLEIEQKLVDLQSKAMRTLAFACLEWTGDRLPDLKDNAIYSDFRLLGYVGIIDPIREEVPSAVASCLSAGIKVKIVTGDTLITAREIARQIGLWKEDTPNAASITGPEFEKLSEDEARELVPNLVIMSRARPTDKQRLVRLLQEKGEVVAVTGDGTNDAPALNFAQVGLSMGSGTAVAKEASDITLLDDSFNSISTAVMWGRSLYQNIQRFIVFQLTINLLALLIVLLGGFTGSELPLTITQMLWVNLIMDTFAALALASIPPSRDVMNDSPRKATDFIITKYMGRTILGVGLSFLVILLSMLYYFKVQPEGITTYHLTYFFTFFVLLQFWNLFNMRVLGTSHSALKGLFESHAFWFVALFILVGQFIIVEYGGAVFRCEPLSWSSWLEIIGYTSLILWIGEGVRWIKRLKNKTDDRNRKDS